MEMNCTYSLEMTRKLPELRFYCMDIPGHKLDFVNARSGIPSDEVLSGEF